MAVEFGSERGRVGPRETSKTPRRGHVRRHDREFKYGTGF